jgi:uncharacterized protein YunC (DUF1805 family)
MPLNAIITSNNIAGKANEFRTVAVQRLREIYGRLLSIKDQVAVMGPAAAAAGNAQAALVELIDAVNAQGYIDPQQAQAMADLATALQGVDIPQMMAGLIGEINQIANTVGVVLGNRNANDQGPVPMTGGRRKRKKAKKSRKRKKKHKGGFKYTRIANSRRSLRMTRRKSLRHKTHHKKHNKKHKRTKKHRRRKRR